ncbi:MAG: hypothetical protein ABIH46_11040 [Chloroflexota bacterium]
MTTLQEQVSKVQALRDVVDKLRKKVQTERSRFDEEHGGLFEAFEFAQAKALDEENSLRNMSLAVYHETGNKAPVPGVAIKIFTRLQYHDEAALMWAIDHRVAMKFDRAAFEKIAKATPIPFVQTIQEPVATIATDLTKAVANP